VRLYNYLTEDTELEDIKDDLLTGLERDCREYKKAVKGADFKYFLYSGRRSDAPDYSIRVPRTDRRPKDMDIQFHTLFDDIFNDVFGWKARSEGLFVTSEFRVAMSYGNPYIVIPFDGFKFIWSPRISDLFNWVRRDATLYNKHPKRDERNAPYLTRYITNVIKKDYKDTDLKRAISSSHEIMLKCTKYYLIDVKYYNFLRDNWING
jgi:hypothetical protein